MDEPMRWDWNPSSVLPYAPIPNPQHDLASTSDLKSTTETGTHLYDRGLTIRKYALVGLVSSGIFSISCIIAGIYIMAIHGGNGAASFFVYTNVTVYKEATAVILNLIVTLCTESTGFVHGISLRSALASESRLRFNTNLRLLTAARGWNNPNGILLNGAMAVLLVLSYTSASSFVLFFRDDIGNVEFASIPGLPLFLMGVTLLLQVVIALAGMRAVDILTWSCSPSDMTTALVHNMRLIPAPLRCMRGVSDVDVDVYGGPAGPSGTQPSAWQAHPSVRKVILSLWGLVVACAVWAAVAMLIFIVVLRSPEAILPWSFFPSSFPGILSLRIPPSQAEVITVQWWILSYVMVALLQSPLTLGLHCSELITNVIRDERQWRRATGKNGLKMVANPLKKFLTDPLVFVPFVAKPVLHWMFGISFNLHMSGDTSDNGMNYIPGFLAVVYITQATIEQIWNLCIALFIFACFCTLIALYRPRGPQPAAYGHLQTLANLVDEWSPVMWWGHKEDGIPYCHAGTSDHPLPAVKMDCVYAGPSVGSHPFISPLGCDL